MAKFEKKASVAHLLVASVMTENPCVVTPTMTIGQVIELLLKHSISGAPVVDQNNRLISFVSEADIMQLAVSDGLETQVVLVLKKLPAEKDLITVLANDEFPVLYKKFLTNSVRRILVVDGSGKVKGVVSRREVIRTFYNSFKTQSSGS